MGDTNKKISIWILIGALIAFATFVLGALFWPLANAVPRCAISWIDWVSQPLLIGDTIVLILSIYFALKALITFKRSTYKTIRIITIVLSVISLVGSISLIIFTVYNSIEVISSSCGVRDIAIKADLSYLRELANQYTENNDGSYEGFCGNDDIKIAYEAIKNNKSALICNDSQQEWAACAQLVHPYKGNYFCSDSSGEAKTILGQCDENWNYISCP